MVVGGGVLWLRVKEGGEVWLGVYISIRSVTGRGVLGPLEDIEGSWFETRMTGSFLTSWMMFFYPEEHTLKIVWWYLKWKCVRMRGSRRGVLGERWGHLTRDMDNRVTPDVLKDIFYPNQCTLKFSCWYLNGRSFRKRGSRRGVIGVHWGLLIRDMDDRVTPDIRKDILLP